jgi:NTP pyrophosphatase (non-canonical NTP hydrolase)
MAGLGLGGMMNATEYQKLAARTLIDEPDFQITDDQIMVVWNALGLAGESGEIVEQIKKGVFHQHGLDLVKLRKELGDVMWYVAALCTKLGFSMDEIMEENIEKLKVRFPEGYTSTDSIARKDVTDGR